MDAARPAYESLAGVISCPSCIRARLRQESTRLPFTCTVHARIAHGRSPFRAGEPQRLTIPVQYVVRGSIAKVVVPAVNAAA